MIPAFDLCIQQGRVVFGPGRIREAAAEVERLGCRRALVLSTSFQRSDAERLAADLGPLAVASFAEATMHTPVEVTERALATFRRTGADCVLAYGGGSTIGLGKAIAWRTDAPQLVVATTYAGSEMTSILGQTENGSKTTIRDARILPESVIYDPELTLSLPVSMSVVSGLNAIAHAVEGLYARDRNPISTLQALEGIRALHDALPAIAGRPGDLGARGEALYGSWLCGTVLGAVGMSLHHKLCHVLGGSFDLPHAETHAIILPHAAEYNRSAAERELAPLASLFGGSVGQGLYDFARSLGAPQALRNLGIREADLDRAADLALTDTYWNPCPIERQPIRSLLQAAWEGGRPGSVIV